jgi:hypothetical protein
VSEFVKLQVKAKETQAPSPTLFSNFLGVARVAGEVQFEFLFLDLNQMAQLLNAGKMAKNPEMIEVSAQTVVKIVMPAGNVIQIKDHLLAMFADIEKEMAVAAEVQNVRNRASS